MRNSGPHSQITHCAVFSVFTHETDKLRNSLSVPRTNCLAINHYSLFFQFVTFIIFAGRPIANQQWIERLQNADPVEQEPELDKAPE
jgi:hypothetical protein